MHVRILNINVMRLPGNLPKITYRSVLPDYRYVLPWLLSSSTWCPWLLTSVTRLPSLPVYQQQSFISVIPGYYGY